MIRLQDLPCPAELTEEVVAHLTEKFQKTGNSVWKKEFILHVGANILQK